MLDAKWIDILETQGYMSVSGKYIYGSAATIRFIYLCKRGQEFVENYLLKHGHEKVNV